MKKTFRVKTFMNGGSQAIRIPAAARFLGAEVLLTYDTATSVVTIENIPEEPNLLTLLEKWSAEPVIPEEVWDEFDSNLAELRAPVDAVEVIADAKVI